MSHAKKIIASTISAAAQSATSWKHKPHQGRGKRGNGAACNLARKIIQGTTEREKGAENRKKKEKNKDSKQKRKMHTPTTQRASGRKHTQKRKQEKGGLCIVFYASGFDYILDIS